MFAIVAAVLFAVALILDIAGVGLGPLGPSTFMLAGLLCLALQLSGIGAFCLPPQPKRLFCRKTAVIRGLINASLSPERDGCRWSESRTGVLESAAVRQASLSRLTPARPVWMIWLVCSVPKGRCTGSGGEPPPGCRSWSPSGGGPSRSCGTARTADCPPNRAAPRRTITGCTRRWWSAWCRWPARGPGGGEGGALRVAAQWRSAAAVGAGGRGT